MKHLLQTILKTANKEQLHDVVSSFIRCQTKDKPQKILAIELLDEEQEGAELEIIYTTKHDTITAQVQGNKIISKLHN